MQKRFLVNTILAVALVFSQGGSFLVAAFCPHLRSGMESCNPHVADPAESQHAAMSHHEMGNTQMESMEHAPLSNADPGGFALRQPIRPCAHCAVHSQTTSNAISLRDTEAAKRVSKLTIPLTVWRVVSPAISPVRAVTSSAHGPPGELTPRHILINIFRI
jgi:hypothetical protein